MKTKNEVMVLTEKDCTGEDEFFVLWYKCPSCWDDYIWKGCNFCPMCGQAVKVDVGDDSLDKVFGVS